MLKYGAETAGMSGEALYYFRRRITYKELLDSVDEFALGLAEEGVKKRRLSHHLSPEYSAVHHCSLCSKQTWCSLQSCSSASDSCRTQICRRTYRQQIYSCLRRKRSCLQKSQCKSHPLQNAYLLSKQRKRHDYESRISAFNTQY